MTPDLYTAIKDVLDYSRQDPTRNQSGYLGFVGGTEHCSRLHYLEKAFTRHEPQKKTLVDTWVTMRDKALTSENERFAFMPATSMIQVRRDPDQCFAEHVQKTPQGGRPNRHGDRTAGVDDVHAARDPVGARHE